MVVMTGWNEPELKKIAVASGGGQILKDVAYGRMLAFHGRKPMCWYIPGIAFLAASRHVGYVRIIGVGVAVSHRRRRIAARLLEMLEARCRERGWGGLRTKTAQGAAFYQRLGWRIVDFRDGHFHLEKDLPPRDKAAD